MREDPRQELYLLRHARAAPWSFGIDDFERVLDERGRAHMHALAGWVSEHLAPPGIILCSPAERTRETLSHVATAWPGSKNLTHFRPEIYEASPGTLQGLVSEALAITHPVLLVGHNPGLELLTRAVLQTADAGRITKMPQGTLAVIGFDRGWEDGAGHGELRHWITRNDL